MKKRSLVVVTVDCLRADHVGFLGYSRPVTPVLDRLAKDSVVFSNAIVAGAPTYFSFPGIMAARHPLALGRDVLGIAPQEATLASALHDAQYSTAAFLAGNPYLSARSGYHQGFDTFRDFLGAPATGAGVPPIHAEPDSFSKLNRRLQSSVSGKKITSDIYDELYFWYCQWQARRQNVSLDGMRSYPAADVMVDHAGSWLGEVGERPFFLWLHLMDPHHPYYPPQAALDAMGLSHIDARRARFLNSFWNRFDIGPERLQRYRKEVLSLYDAGVYWADQQISRLIAALQQSRRWDDTVFVVTADHGEEFLEHGARYHTPSNLPESLIRVPLLLHAPEILGACLAKEAFSLVHLAPTLLEALGVAIPGEFQGQSRWPQILSGTLPDEPAITECVKGNTNPFQPESRLHPRLLSVRDNAYKLVIDFDEKNDRLYDMRSDPRELSPIPSKAFPKERVRLLRAADAHLKKKSGDYADLRLRARLRELQAGPTSAP